MLGGEASKSEFISFHFGAINIYQSWTNTFHVVHPTPAIRDGSLASIEQKLYGRKTKDWTLAHKERVYLSGGSNV